MAARHDIDDNVEEEGSGAEHEGDAEDSDASSEGRGGRGGRGQRQRRDGDEEFWEHADADYGTVHTVPLPKSCHWSSLVVVAYHHITLFLHLGNAIKKLLPPVCKQEYL